MAASIGTAIQDNKHSIKAIILNMPKANHLAYEMKAMDSIPIYCLHADAYPEMAMSHKEITSRLSRFYMNASSNLDDMAQHMQQSDLSTNVQTLHNLHPLQHTPTGTSTFSQSNLEGLPQEQRAAEVSGRTGSCLLPDE
jgi:hypothetical protein